MNKWYVLQRNFLLRLEENKIWLDGPDGSRFVGQQGTGPTLADPTIRQEIITFLRSNRDVFAWSHDDMPGIDPSVMVHRLNVSPSFSLARQKKRVFIC